MCTTDVISSFTPRAYSFISFELGLFYARMYFLWKTEFIIQVILYLIPLIIYDISQVDKHMKFYYIISLYKVLSNLIRKIDNVFLVMIQIFICFGISVYLGRYIGYCVISLYIELNSIFLHLRQLLLFWNVSKQETIYRINNRINICRFDC